MREREKERGAERRRKRGRDSVRKKIISIKNIIMTSLWRYTRITFTLKKSLFATLCGILRIRKFCGFFVLLFFKHG